MEKKQYIQPEMTVSQLETTQQMMVNSLPGRYDASADAKIDVLVNPNDFTDIWGN